ncbi:DUF4012 domain-containing protein [Candidatus Uhrbacteria bacterium]|nr:DUF4012 domain-containing protein [Candidatus Uhrbacteria bacterium]
MEEMLSSSFRRKPPESGDFSSALESQLERVIERDGVTMMSALGPRKRALKNVQIQSLQQEEKEKIYYPIEDPLKDLVLESVAFALKGTSGDSEQEILITRKPHESSKYVVSLHNVFLSEETNRTEELVSVQDALESEITDTQALPVQVYATVTRDVEMESSLAQTVSFSDQFTSDHFEQAYRETRNPFTVISHAFGSLQTSFVSFFRRTRRAEKHLVEEITHMEEEAIGVPFVGLPQVSFVRALVGFAVLAFVVTLPAQAVSLYRVASSHGDEVVQEGKAAVAELESIRKDLGTPDSIEALRGASSKFREADALLSQTGALALTAASVLPKQYRSARALFEIGDKSSEAARLLALGYEKAYSDPQRRLDERFDVLGAYTRSALLLLSDARKATATIEFDSVPEPQRAQLKQLLPQLEKSSQALQEVSALTDVLAVMVGKEGLRKYLLVFQNPTELRPTGGFMGSLAEVTFDKGNLRDIRVPHGGTYDLKGQLTMRLQSPKPLQLINAQWQFQDANWYPDFLKTAQNLRWFWSKAGQPTIDGVVAVNATFMEDVLRITGPIAMPEYGKTIDASNFMLETQKSVELEYDKANNTPKKFIADLSEKLRDRMKALTKTEWVALATAVSHALETKDIQIASFHEQEQDVVDRYGWSGRMKPTVGDALALIETNIAGQKTDGVIKEQVKHEVTISEDGRMETSVILQRTHTGGKGELFRGVRNVSYLRVYVPKGSVLLSASGFRPPNSGLFKSPELNDAQDPAIFEIESSMKKVGDVDVMQEGDRTVFGGWLQLDPGETQEIRFSYRLPFLATELLNRIDSSVQDGSMSSRAAYLMLFTSQSGKKDRQLSSNIIFPANWNLSWSKTGKKLEYSGPWDSDIVMAGLFSPGL